MVQRAPQNLRGDGRVWDLSEGPTFDFAEFYRKYEDQEMLQISKDELSWIRRHDPAVAQKVDVLLNLSCGAQWAPHHLLQAVDVFKALDVSFAAVAGRQYCCGRIYERFGREDDGDRMVAASMRHFGDFEAKEIVQICGSCQIAFDYAIEKRKEDNTPAGFETVQLTLFIRDRMRELGDRIPWKQAVKRRVLVHGHLYDDSEAYNQKCMLEILDMIPGVEVVGECKESSLGLPCATTKPGGPSVLWDITPEQYKMVVGEFTDYARSLGANAWCHTYNGCTTHWAKFGTDELPSLHFLQILGEALGCPQPDRYQTLWRLGDPERILEQSRVHWESWGMSEERARATVLKYFTPKFAAAIQRCPCDGRCDEDRGAACQTLGTRWLKRGAQQLDVVPAAR
jgi:hypothetical protein